MKNGLDAMPLFLLDNLLRIDIPKHTLWTDDAQIQNFFMAKTRETKGTRY